MKSFAQNKIVLSVGVGLSGVILSKYLCYYGNRHGKTNLVFGAKNDTGDEIGRQPNDDTLRLKSVQIFFRHGARTPLTHLPQVAEVSIHTFIID